MDNDVLANLSQGGLNALEAETEKQENETPADPPAENKQEEASPSQAGENTLDESKLPFHKHPRWNAMRKENEELRNSLREISEWRQSAENRLSDVSSRVQPNSEHLPDWFVKAFGENPDAYEAWKGLEKGMREGIKEELRQDIENQKAQQIQQEKHYLEWVDESIGALEESVGVDLRSKQNENLRNEILKVAVDFQPTSLDEKGAPYIDLKKAYEIHKRLKAENSEAMKAKKSLAGSTMSGASAEGSKKDFLTPSDTRRMSWSNFN